MKGCAPALTAYFFLREASTTYLLDDDDDTCTLITKLGGWVC
jgi:hypothetical protein